jgi:hypothetical protein
MSLQYLRTQAKAFSSFLVASRSRQPLIPARNGRGLQDATIDTEVIKRWFQDHRIANIASGPVSGSM